MKRLFPSLALIFLSQSLFSQLYIGPKNSKEDNFLYVKEGVLFVSNDIHLNKNFQEETLASLYLRNQANLIQGHAQNNPNTGNGMLSVFQNGTANAYDYNYWASPVGNSSGKNGLFGINMLYAPQTKTSSTPANITSSLNGTSKPLHISSRWIYTYSGHSYSDWRFTGAEVSIPAGYGYSMKGVDGTDNIFVEDKINNPGGAQRYDFRGRPNSGTIEIPLAANDFVLVGNPYPSSLDLSLFLLMNSGTGSLNTDCHGPVQRENATTGIAYFWDSRENGNSHYLQDYVGGYGTFSPVAPCTAGLYEAPLFKSYGTVEIQTGQRGKHIDRRSLPIAQGFMVKGAEGKPLVFKNSQRIYSIGNSLSTSKIASQEKNQLLQQDHTVPNVKLQIEINGEYVRGLTLGFWPTATSGIDPGMDALAYDLAPADVGWIQNEESYVIDVRPFEMLQEIPLYLQVQQHKTSFRFQAKEPENTQIENIYILDLETKTYHSVFKEVFEIELEPGNYNGRFNLTFTKGLNEENNQESLELSQSEDVVDGLSIFQNNTVGQLEIFSGTLFTIKSVGVYDLQGKRISFESTLDNSHSLNISTKHLANGVYIVKVRNKQNTIKSKKIMVLNRQ